MNVLEIEAEIKKLPGKEALSLFDRLQDYREELWDAQIADDLEMGRLDKILAEVDAAIARGESSPL